MSAEIRSDPYITVAQLLREGEMTRAELKSVTQLDYAPIQAALERFELMENIEKRTDGMGVEHYSWKGQPYQPVQPRDAILVPNNNGHQKIAPLPVEENPEVNKNGRPVGWSLSAVVREYVHSLVDSDRLSVQTVYEALSNKYPKATETYTSADLRTQISVVLGQMVGKTISRVGEVEGGRGNLYCKGVVGEAPQPQSKIKRPQIVTGKRKYTKRQSKAPTAKQQDQSVVKSTPALNPYEVVLADLRGERDQLDLLIRSLERRIAATN